MGHDCPVIVLHAAWATDGPAGDGLALWAEDADKPRRLPPRRGRPARVPRPRPHPFALDAFGVAAAISELGGIGVGDLIGGDVTGDGAGIELVLRLPGAPTGPHPSPWIEYSAPSEPAGPGGPGSATGTEPPRGVGGRPEFPQWQVPALVLDPATAMHLLAVLAPSITDGSLATGSESVAVEVANDLAFAVRAAGLALELVARGRILPTLEPTTGSGAWVARWRPVVDGADRSRVQALVTAAPPSFAAASGGNLATVTQAFFWAVTDALARELAPPPQPAPVGRLPTSGRSRGRAAAPARSPRRAATAPRVPAPDPAAAAVAAWMAALSSTDPVVVGDPEALASLAAGLRGWHATQTVGSDLLRVCFRVVPPDEPAPAGEAEPPATTPAAAGRRGTRAVEPPAGNDWQIEFALQAVDDPSLLVTAPAVWSGGPELAALAHHADHPDEHLLRGLGLAARLVPALAPSLAAAAPSGLTTDAAGILSFLRDGAPILEEAGFGVLAPPWWRTSRARLGLRLRARSRTKGSSSAASRGLGDLWDVRWEVALGDDAIGVTELRRLAKLKEPLVRVRGQWVELSQGDLEAAIAAVATPGAPADQLTAGEVLRTALGIEPEHGGLPVTGVAADGWLGDLLAGADDRRIEPVATPASFNGDLRPYQERGLAWLSFLGTLGLGACLADDMGLGKTAQLLAVLVDEHDRHTSAATSPTTTRSRARSRSTAGSGAGPAASAKASSKGRSKTEAQAGSAAGSGPGPTLVLCPMSLVGNWEREAARFAPKLSVLVHHGPGRLSGTDFTRQASAAGLVLSTYGVAVRDRDLLSTVPWNRLVLDEAQHIKNASTRVAQSVRSIDAASRIALTGTPVENRLSELWSIMQFLNPGLLGSEKAFRRRFAAPIEREGDDEAAERLRQVTGPFVLRRLKTDRSIIADLPDKIEMKEYCTLTREQASLYQAVVDDMLARIEESDGMERRGLVLATMMKLKQVCNHPAHFLADGSTMPGRSGKLTRLVEVLEEAAAEGDRSLVFTQFTEMGGMLERYLRHRLGCEVLWLHGGVSKKARDGMVERFQGEGGPAVFLLSLKAGGTGLNLTGATQVIHFDRWWNPAVENQATDRAYRIGQRRTVQVRKFVCGGTLEERIDAMIDEKRALAERIVGTGEGWITELSTAQLRDVVALSSDAVGED